MAFCNICGQAVEAQDIEQHADKARTQQVYR